MIVTITSVRLRKLWYYFPLTYRALFITLQIRRSPGFIEMKNTGSGYLHFTLSAWKTEEDMRTFARSGKHAEAVRHASELASEVRTLTYETDELPPWDEARAKLFAEGRVINFKGSRE